VIERRAFSAGALSLPFLALPARADARAANGYLITDWASDPWAFGSYSHMAKGAGPIDRVTLAEPLNGRLFFAGEATDSDHPATVHGALLTGRKAAEKVLNTGARRIAIVGSGFAGLGAANWIVTGTLADEFPGTEVTVFEARDRIGGRVHTNHDLGMPLDLGASWIHGTRGNPLSSLADRLGVKRYKTKYSNAVNRGPNGIKTKQEPDWLNDVWVRQTYGADPDWLSDQAQTEGALSRGGDVLFDQGYSSLLPGLTGGYEIRLSSRITQIDWSDGVVLNGEHVFDAVIVTVPLGVLKAGTITFKPALPERKKQAIDRLGFGVLDKLYLRFDDIFWDKDAEWITYTTPQPNAFPSWLNMAAYTGAPVLMAFAGGSAAQHRATKSDTDILDAAQAALTDMYPI